MALVDVGDVDVEVLVVVVGDVVVVGVCVSVACPSGLRW